jgi:flagellar motor switch protein FliM
VFNVGPEHAVALKCGDIHLTSGKIGRLGERVSVKVNRNLRRPRMTLAAFERAVQTELEKT